MSPARWRESRKGLGVFLNIPYDPAFERLYIAYIAGLSAFGLVARSALEIPSGGRQRDRISRIFSIMLECKYSLHDLSHVKLDRAEPSTPRFNMPFELGMAAALTEFSNAKDHIWFVFEARAGRLAKSLSDLRGVDEFVHHGSVSGLLGCLNNAFVRPDHRPRMSEVKAIYRDLRRNLPSIQAEAGAHSAFEARVFLDLAVQAGITARRHISWLAR